jgi:hypothetical protein
MEEIAMVFETLRVSREGAVLYVEILAPPMNLLGPELVRDLVSLIRQTEADECLLEHDLIRKPVSTLGSSLRAGFFGIML